MAQTNTQQWSPSMFMVPSPGPEFLYNLDHASDSGVYDNLVNILDHNAQCLYEDPLLDGQHDANVNPLSNQGIPQQHDIYPSLNQGPTILQNASTDTIQAVSQYCSCSVESLFTQVPQDNKVRQQCFEIAQGIYEGDRKRHRNMSQPISLVLGQPPPIPIFRGLFTRDYPVAGNMLHHVINLTCWIVLVGPHYNYLKVGDWASHEYLLSIACNTMAYIWCAHAHTYPYYPPENCKPSI